MTPTHDPQESQTMQQVRRARAEVAEARAKRTPEEQRRMDEELARRFGLKLSQPAADPRADGVRRSA